MSGISNCSLFYLFYIHYDSLFEVVRNTERPNQTDRPDITLDVYNGRKTTMQQQQQQPEAKIAEIANCVDLDEVAHNKPPHLDLHCLPSSFSILNMILLGLNIF